MDSSSAISAFGITLMIIFFFYSSGRFIKIESYNYYRGRLDGLGMTTTKIKCPDLIIAWILFPLGIWYILGWHLAGNKGYDLGRETGEGDRRQIDIIGERLIDGSYYKLD